MSTEEIGETNIEELPMQLVYWAWTQCKTNSGHPGMVMGMADITTVLYHDFLTYDPQDHNFNKTVLFYRMVMVPVLPSMLHLTGIS